MYSFQFGGNIEEYFGRYRRLLNARADIRKRAPGNVGGGSKAVAGAVEVRALSITIAAALAITSFTAPLAPQHMVISTNPHFFAYKDGKPFFWLGDTAWLLFSKLDHTETEKYLDDRRSKGFTVIQVSVLHSPGDEVGRRRARPDR